jgi:hypothetical protein
VLTHPFLTAPNLQPPHSSSSFQDISSILIDFHQSS